MFGSSSAGIGYVRNLVRFPSDGPNSEPAEGLWSGFLAGLLFLAIADPPRSLELPGTASGGKAGGREKFPRKNSGCPLPWFRI